MRVIFALERTNSFREKAYIDTNKPKSPMKANFMFSKEGRCASHYNRQNPIRLDKPRNTEPKFHLVNKNLRVEFCCPHHVHSPTKWVRDPGEPHLLCIKTRVVSRRICLKDSTSQIDFSWKAFIFFFLTYYFSFSFSALDVFKLRAQNQHLENTAHKTTQCVCSIHIPSAMGWIFQVQPPGPTLFPGHISMDAELRIGECFLNFCTVLVYVITLTNKLLLLLEMSQICGLQGCKELLLFSNSHRQ